MRREQFIQSVQRKGYQTIPIDVELCESQIRQFEKRFGHTDYLAYFAQLHRPVEMDVKKNFENGHDLYLRETLPEDTLFDAFGVGHSKGSELAYHMTRMHHPLKGADLKEIKTYPYPSLDEPSIQKLKKEVADLHFRDFIAYAKMHMTIWEASWYMRSMEELMIDMMMEDEKAVVLLDMVTDFSCQRAEVYAEAGADVLGLGDDIGTQKAIMIDQDLWRKWLQPRLKKVIDTAKAIKPDILIFYHSCGYILPFIDELIETGVEILNPIQPESMDFNEIHDQFGDRVSFWGTLGTQQLLPFGTAEEVYTTTIERLKKCSLKGGIVIGPTHLVEPEVPWENLEAIKKAVKDFEKSRN